MYLSVRSAENPRASFINLTAKSECSDSNFEKEILSNFHIIASSIQTKLVDRGIPPKKSNSPTLGHNIM